MSSWIIEDKTINKLVDFFINCAYSKEEYKPEVARILNKEGYNLEYKTDDSNPDAEKLGVNLKTLNLKAWNYRYNKKGLDVDFVFEPVHEKNIYQILKSLDCFIYQCSERDIIKDKLYIALSDISKILKNYIITHLEDYKKAKWE